MLKRLLSKLSGRPAISTQDRQAIVAYLTDELKIAVFKDMEASRFYGLADMASGSARLLQAAAEIIRRHSQLDATGHSSATYRAWHDVYETYEAWVSKITSALTAGATPRPDWGEELRLKSIRAGDETTKLHQLLSLNAEDLLRMTLEAQSAVEKEGWRPID